MASSVAPQSRNSLETVEWTWSVNSDSSSRSARAEWKPYSDLENLIIEEAFQNKQPQALLDDYYIDFANNRQISNTDNANQRPVKREMRRRDDKKLREARFMDLPVSTGRSFGSEYGWVSVFIIEVRRYLKLGPDDLPSKKPNMVPMLVEKAAHGIVEEGKHLAKQREAEKLANMLREKKESGMEEVWKCCAYLYTLESFLYKTLNAAMRLVGDQNLEQVWRSKISTLGPFCLLLWDDPLNTKLTTRKTLYRGANLEPRHIAKYKEMADDKKAFGSFQAYTSCTRNREATKNFGNVLFIMEVLLAFTADISKYSKYKAEDEELVTPGVCFRVKSVEFDSNEKRHLITLQLIQRFSTKGSPEIRNQQTDVYTYINNARGGPNVDRHGDYHTFTYLFDDLDSGSYFRYAGSRDGYYDPNGRYYSDYRGADRFYDYGARFDRDGNVRQA